MADEESTNPTQAVEAQETDSSSDEDFDLWDDDAEEPTETEETTEDEAATESEEESEETSEQSDEGSEETQESEEQDQDSDGEDTNPEELSEDDRKRYNEEMYKRRQAEKQLRDEREANQQATIERYLQEAENDEIEYQKRLIEVEAFNVQKERIQLNAERLQTGIDKAVATIDLFQNGAPEIKEELLSAVDEFERTNVEYDAQGNPIKVKGDVYTFLQNKADSIRRIQGVGERQAKKDKTETKSRTVTPPSKTPKPPKTDEASDAFDEEASRW